MQWSIASVRFPAMFELLFMIPLLVWVAYLYVWWYGGLLQPNFPPGPKGLPLVGCLPLAYGRRLEAVFDGVSLSYAGIFHLPFAHFNVIVLNNWNVIKKALYNQADTFSGRPTLFVLERVTQRRGILCADGGDWKERRRFVCLHFNHLGKAMASAEDVILAQLRGLGLGLDSNCRHLKVQMDKLLFSALTNILWRLLAGRTYEYDVDDERSIQFVDNLRMFLDALNACQPLNAFPVLRFLPGTPFSRLMKCGDKLRHLIEGEVERHGRTAGHCGYVGADLIDAFLARSGEMKPSTDSQSDNTRKGDLVGIILDLFIAGVDSTSSTLQWCFLYLATWPKIQENVREEIDRVIGQARLPSCSDRASMAYTEAVLLEVQRHAIVSPFSVAHCNVAKARLQGYLIPTRSWVIPNISAVHFDPYLWGDPEIFRPERFIDKTGKVQKPEYLIPFSIGARRCVGESLAKSEMFLFVVYILQRYRLVAPTGEKPPLLETVDTVSTNPAPYSLIFECRQ